MYRHTDPALADAYRVTAQAVRAEQLKSRRADQRRAQLHSDMRRPHTAYVSPGEWTFSPEDAPVPLATDLGSWLEMQGGEVVGRCMFDPTFRSERITQYIDARVRVELDALNWHDELVADDECAQEAEADRRREDAIFEQGGMV